VDAHTLSRVAAGEHHAPHSVLGAHLDNYDIRDVVMEGSRKAQALAHETMERVRSAVKLKY
jgi:hypothetical protein